jgi:hypothetical protein
MVSKLNSMGVSKTRTPGLYGDGGGLWLQVTPGGKSWTFRFLIRGKVREMGLGSVATFSVAEARDRAREARKLVADGIDPIEARKAQRSQQALDAAKSLSFDECAANYIAAHKAGWKRREARRSMAGDARRLRLADLRQAIRRQHRHRTRRQGA